MATYLIQKASVIWWVLLLSTLTISCSSPARETGRHATVQRESVTTDKEEQEAVRSYLGLVFQKLEGVKIYPSLLSQSGLSGRVILRFTARWDGEIVDPEITEVSGHESFGNAALQTLKRIGQLPPFPDAIRRRELLVEVPITYRSAVRLSVPEDDAEGTGTPRETFSEWLTDEMTAAMDEASAAMEQGSTLGYFAAWQRLAAQIQNLAEEGNVHAQDFLAALERSYSELGAELEIGPDTLAVLRTLTFGKGKQQTETWHCFKLFDRNKAKALFTLVRMRIGGKDFMGEVSVAGTSHVAGFQVAGLNRRWDWGCNEKTGCRYAFGISPDNIGKFYDFSVSDDGRAKPSQVFECQLSP